MEIHMEKYGDTHVETKEIHMAKIWRFTWRSYGDTHGKAMEIHVETKEIHMEKLWRCTCRN
jgi:hypothetical protein